MKAGLVGPSYEMKSLPFDAQRCINLYPVISEAQSKEPAALYGTPGLRPFGSIGDGPIRGLIRCGNGRAFGVSGNTFYEFDSAGTATSRGTISTFDGSVSMAENGLQLMIATGTNGYIFTFASNAFALISDVDFPGANYVSFQDGYFIATKPSSGEFYISALYDGTSWDALDFATAETSPDNLVAAFSAYGQLWLFGERTTEIWYNSGEVDFPYARVQGAKMETGCAARFSIAKADNSIFWVGQDDYGQGIVYRATGYSPQRISTQAIELKLRESGTLTNLIGFCYQQEGHLFYVLSGGSLETTFVYDVSTSLWHERAYYANGEYSRWLGLYHCFAFGKNITGDRLSGNLYEIDPDYYSDNGQEIRRSRIFTHINNEGKRFTINYLQVDFERGVGLTTGQGNNPLAWLRLSKDGGRTWSNEYETSIGAIGEYKKRAVWRRMGQQEQATFEVSISDPVKVIITGAYFG